MLRLHPQHSPRCARPYAAVYCPCCGFRLPPSGYAPPLHAELAHRVRLSYTLKLLLYSALAPRLPLPPLPHDAADCPLCLWDNRFVRRWLLQDGRAEMEDAIRCAVGELHC